MDSEIWEKQDALRKELREEIGLVREKLDERSMELSRLTGYCSGWEQGVETRLKRLEGLVDSLLLSLPKRLPPPDKS